MVEEYEKTVVREASERKNTFFTNEEVDVQIELEHVEAEASSRASTVSPEH